MIEKEKCPKKSHNFLGVWLVYSFCKRKAFHRSNVCENSTEDPISGILRLSRTVFLQPLFLFIKVFSYEKTHRMFHTFLCARWHIWNIPKTQ